MCFFGPRIIQQAPAPLPEPRPTPPRPEPTAERVVVGDKRTSTAQTRPAPSSVTGQQTTGDKVSKREGQREASVKRLGTSSLRIPLKKNTNTTGDLNI